MHAIRAGGGPVFLECRCYALQELSRPQIQNILANMRQSGQYSGLLAYKRKQMGPVDLDVPLAWRQADPVAKLRDQIMAACPGAEPGLDALAAEAAGSVADALEWARRSPEPPLAEALQGVFSP